MTREEISYEERSFNILRGSKDRQGEQKSLVLYQRFGKYSSLAFGTPLGKRRSPRWTEVCLVESLFGDGDNDFQVCFGRMLSVDKKPLRFSLLHKSRGKQRELSGRETPYMSN